VAETMDVVVNVTELWVKSMVVGCQLSKMCELAFFMIISNVAT